MPIPIQTDPISVVINAAALLVAIVQLCLMWGQRTRRTQANADFDEADRQVRCTDEGSAYTLY